MAGLLVSILSILALTVVVLVACQHVQWRRACRAGAASLYSSMSQMYAGEHAYRVVAASDFPDVNQAGYQRVRAFLLERGFRLLGSAENLTVSSVYPEHRTFIDFYVSPDSSFGAATYCILDQQTVDFAAALKDGRFLVTTNAALDTLTPPPTVLKCILPADAALADLLARHEGRLAVLRTAEPAVQFLEAASVEDAIENSRRHSRVAAEYRQAIGLLTEAEALSLATRLDQERTARRIWSEFRVLAARAAPAPASALARGRRKPS